MRPKLRQADGSFSSLAAAHMERLMSDRHFLTSESVADGHPDKICDQISDAILDACLAQDPNSRVAVETALKHDIVCILGEVTSRAKIDTHAIVAKVLSSIGHAGGAWGLDPDRIAIVEHITQQSPDIGQGVGREDGQTGAGDQGMMFGFACKDTPELMPLPIMLAHKLMRRQKEFRETPAGRILGPDAKAQVTVLYEGERPIAIDTILVSTQHRAEITQSDLHELVREEIMKPVLPLDIDSSKAKFLVNPTGAFVTGGPLADAGLTGRKIIVDTYGGAARHGGGAFSGKDATKVDRSAAYAARQMAKSVVASGLAERAELQVSYAIGVPEPVSLSLWTDSGTKLSGEEILATLWPDAPALLTPDSIISRLDLRRPIFRQTAAFGHFGRNGLPWEKVLEPSAAKSKAKALAG
jgi:S-adenosylmethionine synthetase